MNPLRPACFFACLVVGLAAETFAPIDDSTFGREVKSHVTVGLGFSYAKATHNWYDLSPFDLLAARLRLLSDAGDFSPILRGVYADLEFSYGSMLLGSKAWTLSLWNLFAIHLGFSFRDGRRDKTFFPYVQIGTGYNGGTTRAQGATVSYDGALFYQVKTGFEWVIGGFLSIGPGISLTQYPFAYALVQDPQTSIAFHADVHLYFP
ncbi:MAG: hypothetical protein J0L75_11920 [Spirochaetes bacterium]|nr:hypothetical protein [Spirochaetota bacterium]